jgi:hypothetical protein
MKNTKYRWFQGYEKEKLDTMSLLTFVEKNPNIFAKLNIS